MSYTLFKQLEVDRGPGGVQHWWLLQVGVDLETLAVGAARVSEEIRRHENFGFLLTNVPMWLPPTGV